MDKPLEDGDYRIKEDGIWLTVENLSIRIWNDKFNDSVEDKIYRLGEELSDSLASMRVLYDMKA